MHLWCCRAVLLSERSEDSWWKLSYIYKLCWILKAKPALSLHHFFLHLTLQHSSAKGLRWRLQLRTIPTLHISQGTTHHMQTWFSLYTSFALSQSESLCPPWPLFPHPSPCRKGETVGEVTPSPAMLEPWQIAQSWPKTESPGWFLWVQAA